MSVAEYAEKHLPDGYDRIYCVFDRNGHANYDEAVKRIASLERVHAIPSIPCFEIWILLHFKYTSAPFERTGKHSACDNIIREVKREKEISDYRKGDKDLYDKLIARMDDAVKHARRLEAYNSKNGSYNPATKVHELVEYLRHLKMPAEVNADELKLAVEQTHGGQARLVQSVPVHERFDGETVWRGIVHIFVLEGHRDSKLAYAWSSAVEGSDKRRFYAVLHQPPVESPIDAVRAAIVTGHRQKKK